MTFVNARQSYRRSETLRGAEISDPHEIIGVALGELSKSLHILCAAQQGGQKYPDHHLNRALTALYILQSSLDFESGGEIATNLFQVYEYCRVQVADAFARKADTNLTAACRHIDAIREAWMQIGVRA